jgi:8-oxo-dGTP pyrophosphatase MutT (NUDIX family)
MNSSDILQMEAAGGLVLCGGHVLLIRKHGLWDIPKGKVKRQEPHERCALREISEETGLCRKQLRIRSLLCRTSYISYYSGKPFNKTVSWFLLDYTGEIADPLSPDLSEDIDLCEWVALDDLLDKLDAARPYLLSVRKTVSESLHLLRQAPLDERAGFAAS